MKCYLQNAPENESVFQFIDKKRAESKPYYVYMTAAANKFLRRYGGMKGLGGRSLFSVDFDTDAKVLREFIYGVTDSSN